MTKEKNTATDAKSEKPKKKKVIVRAEKTRVRLPSGIYVYKYRNDVIKDPWPELLKLAATPSGRRIFAIIEE